MLGTGKVKAVTDKTSPEDILTDFYEIKDTNRQTAIKRSNALFAKSSSAHRKVITPGMIEASLDEDIEDVESVVTDSVSRPYIIQSCAIISNYTSAFKRKCTVGKFMASGATLRYADEFRLRIDTDDPVKNAENEEINGLIDDFRDKLNKEFEDTVLEFHAYMENVFPPEVRDVFIVKSGDYFTQEDAIGNIHKAVVKAYRDIGKEISQEDFEGFKDLLRKYRAMTRTLLKPDDDRVVEFLGVDKKAYQQAGRDGLRPLVNIIPTNLAKDLIDGE